MARTQEVVQSLFDDDMLRIIGKSARELICFSPHMPKSAYYLQSISVTGAGRNRGIGKLLLENAFEKARKAGLKSVHLDVYADNPAIRFYEKMGMKIWVETRLLELAAHGIKTQYRMVKQL